MVAESIRYSILDYFLAPFSSLIWGEIPSLLRVRDFPLCNSTFLVLYLKFSGLYVGACLCFNFANNNVRQVIIYILFGQEESETGLGEEEDEERLNVSALHIFIAMYANFLSSFITM